MAHRTATTAAHLKAALAALAAQPAIDETQLHQLRNRGTDAYSRLKLPELIARVGVEARAPVLAALADPADQMAALRWILRGLPCDLAIRKRQLQRERHPGPEGPRAGAGLPSAPESASCATAPPVVDPPPAPVKTPPRAGPPLSPAAAAPLLAQPEFRRYFEQALGEVLAGRDRQVLDLRYGLRTGPARTLDAIGQQLGVTRERARQLLGRGWRRLRRQAARQRRAGLPPGPQAACAWIVDYLAPARSAGAAAGHSDSAHSAGPGDLDLLVRP